MMQQEGWKLYKKILLGMDGSEQAKKAAKKAMSLQEAWDSKVVAFHSLKHHIVSAELPFAVPIEGPETYGLSSQIYEQVQEAYVERGRELLDQTETMFQERGLSVETRLVRDEGPGAYIIQTAEEEDFDLVVVGCKGEHSTLEKVLLGTVSEKVVNNAPCDVLVVR